MEDPPPKSRILLSMDMVNPEITIYFPDLEAEAIGEYHKFRFTGTVHHAEASLMGLLSYYGPFTVNCSDVTLTPILN